MSYKNVIITGISFVHLMRKYHMQRQHEMFHPRFKESSVFRHSAIVISALIPQDYQQMSSYIIDKGKT